MPWVAKGTLTLVPADISLIAFGRDSRRSAGTGDFPFGLLIQRPISAVRVTYRMLSADAGGSTVVELRKNGVQLAGSRATIAAGSQLSSTVLTPGTAWSLVDGDVLTVYVVSTGTNPGKGLIADIKAVCA